MFIGSFGSWFSLGGLGRIASVFLGDKIWLVIFGIAALSMMIITWPKKNKIIALVDFD